MPTVRSFLVFLLTCAASVNAPAFAETPGQPSSDFRYLEPGAMKMIPATLRADLAKRGCRIPMFAKWDARHNAIQGQFLRPGQQDWAFLCQSGSNTVILIYPGPAAEASLLRMAPTDLNRMIHVASPFVLRKRAVRDNPSEPPPEFDHDAIEDGPVGLSTTVLYHTQGNWEER